MLTGNFLTSISRQRFRRKSDSKGTWAAPPREIQGTISAGGLMQRHIKAQPQERYQEIVPPGTMRFLDFGRLDLQPGERYFGGTGAREYVLDLFSGTASITVEDAEGKTLEFNSVGSRSDVFSGAPVMLYMPPRSAYEITAVAGKLDVGIFSAPS